MDNREFFGGVVVPMISPFTEAGDVDAAAVARIVERFVASGVPGIFVLGTTGEAASMPGIHKTRMVEAAAKAVAGQSRRIALYAGISGNCLAESIDQAGQWRGAGVDAVVAHPPYYYPISDAMLEKYFEKLLTTTALPLTDAAVAIGLS